jgi:hypothetical protein
VQPCNTSTRVLLDGAPRVQRIAVAGVGIGDERKRADRGDALGQRRDVGTMQVAQVGQTQRDGRRDRPRQMRDAKPCTFEQQRRHRVVAPRRLHASWFGEDRAQTVRGERHG